MPYEPHRNGRPPRGDTATKPYSLRLTVEETAALEQHAALAKAPASILVRQAMAEAGLFDPPRKRRARARAELA